jgi:glycerate kinase
MHVLIAPNAFKNSLDAATAAEAIEKGLHRSQSQYTTTCFPVADGGDGTAALLVKHLKGKHESIKVLDPLGRKITAPLGLIGEDTTVIELADASGLRLLKPAEYAPLHTTTFGTGELIREAFNRKVTKLILCVGGSATVDGGAGMLKALGMRFLDSEGQEITDLPNGLIRLSSIDNSRFISKPSGMDIVVLCDVENILLGPQGAAAVFGPQKGASLKDVLVLDKCLSGLRDIALQSGGRDMNNVKHGGAAGGIAAALHTFLDAKLVNGIDYFLDITGFEKVLQRSDVVITGEGSIDSQTLQGKGPFGVARLAKQYYLRVIGMAGKIASDEALLPYFDKLVPINGPGTDIETALKNTYINLEKAAYTLGQNGLS